jgi:hypothetical protein
VKLHLAELDCIFISYDEPNAEKNWADLLDKCMWAKHVHGVKGSDEAHKTAANLSDTEWFITVDADNIVDTTFFDQEIEVPEGALAFSWPGVNIINGLRYGNGSLKVWRKDFVLNMKSHEAADKDQNQVDFCWEDGYRPMVESFSVTYPNDSPYQAWRAGFREGVKMSLVDGVRPEVPNINKLHWHNLHRLKVWMSVGAHANNGQWAIFGATIGCYLTNCTDWDYIEVRDFDRLATLWETYSMMDPEKDLLTYKKLIEKDFGLEVVVLDPKTSLFVVNLFKEQYDQAVAQAMWTLERNRV